MEHGRPIGLWMALTTVLTLVSPLAMAQPTKLESPPAPVTTARVEEGAFTKPVRLTGTVEALASTTLSSEVAGYVEKLLVDAGDTVREGQILGQIRAITYRLLMAQAQAMARVDRERLRELKTGARREDLEVAKANLAKAKVTANVARKNHARSVSLQQRRIVSDEEFDQAYERLEESQAEVAVRQAIYDRALAGAREEAIAAAEAQAAASKAEADLARVRLESATMRAPFDGVVTFKHTEVGSWVAVGDDLFDLEKNHKVRVRVDIPEAFYNHIPIGSDVWMTFDSAPNATFVGKVTQKIPRAQGRSRAFPVKVELDNPQAQLATGMLARVNLKTPHEGQTSVIVPRDALVPRGPKQILYRVQDQDGQPVAELIEVQSGRYFGEAVEVFGDLRAGDRVVVRGNERLRPGQPLVLNQFRTN